MKIHTNLVQGTPEWHEIRARNFTASELDTWILDPKRITKTVDEIKAILDNCGISRKGVTKRDELIYLLPDAESLMELCQGAKTAIIRKIVQGERIKLKSLPFESLPLEIQMRIERDNDLESQREKQFEYNIAVKYGKLFEPSARSAYESITGHEVTEAGFIECSGYGCSPDGLIYSGGILSHGVEIKCPLPETFLAWQMDGGLPEEHEIQIHASMACAGVDRWDFFAYNPGEESIHIPVYWDETTDNIKAGLKIIVSEKYKLTKQ